MLCQAAVRCEDSDPSCVFKDITALPCNCTKVLCYSIHCATQYCVEAATLNPPDSVSRKHQCYMQLNKIII